MNWSKPVAYDDPAKSSFHATARARLRKLATAISLPKSAYDLRSNKGGIAVSGEVILHTDALYVLVLQSCDGMGILIRTCNGRKDYTGGPNHWIPLAMLDDIPGLARFCQSIGS